MENEVNSKNFIETIIEKDLAEGKCTEICTRFPPEPNGYLHIGHAKSILLNYGLAKKYGGKFNMRFDDTNPTKEKLEFVESIQEDIRWLGAKWDETLFASNYFPQMYESAVKLIKKGKAYVSDLSAEQIREYRGTLTEPGKEDPSVNRSVEENLALFEDMKNGKFTEEDIKNAKKYMTSGIESIQDEQDSEITYYLGQELSQKLITFKEYAQKIEEITAEDVKEVANKIKINTIYFLRN